MIIRNSKQYIAEAEKGVSTSAPKNTTMSTISPEIAANPEKSTGAIAKKIVDTYNSLNAKKDNKQTVAWNELVVEISNFCFKTNNLDNAQLYGQFKNMIKAEVNTTPSVQVEAWGAAIKYYFVKKFPELFKSIDTVSSYENQSTNQAIINAFNEFVGEWKNNLSHFMDEVIDSTSKVFEQVKSTYVKRSETTTTKPEKAPSDKSDDKDSKEDQTKEKSSTNSQEEQNRDRSYFLHLKASEASCTELGDAYRKRDEKGRKVLYILIKEEPDTFVDIDTIKNKWNDTEGDIFEYKEILNELKAEAEHKEQKQNTDSKYKGILPEEQPASEYEKKIKSLLDAMADTIKHSEKATGGIVGDFDIKKESTEDYLKKRLVAGILGTPVKDIKGVDVTPLSGTALYSAWYDSAWNRLDAAAGAGNRVQIEAYYIYYEYPAYIGDVEKVAAINRELTSSSSTMYNKIKTAVYADILSKHFKKVWDKYAMELIKEYKKELNLPDSTPDEVAQALDKAKSLKIKTPGQIKANSVISSKIKVNGFDNWFNWKVNSVGNTSVILSLLEVFCNGYNVTRLHDKELKKEQTVPISDIINGDWYLKAYSVSNNVVESLEFSKDALDTFISFDDICDIFDDSEHTTSLMSIANDIINKLGVANRLNDVVIYRTNNYNLSPEYLDSMEMKECNGFVIYELYIEDEKTIKVALQNVDTIMYLYFANQSVADKYFELIK